MIHKKTFAVGIALFLLLIVYSIATATGWQDSTQPLAARPATAVPEKHDQVAGAADVYSGKVAPSEGIASSTGSMGTEKIISGSGGEVQAIPLEESLNTTWLIEWIVQGVGALALLTAGLLGIFSLVQRSRRA